MSEMGPTQLNIPRDYFYGDIDCEIAKPDPHRARRRRRKEPRRGGRAAGHGEVPGDHLRRRRGDGRRRGGMQGAGRAPRRAGGDSYLHNDSFPASHPLWCGPLGYQGSKAGMKLIAQADVVLALGTRLGPFGTLPQHGMDYWPKQAKIIQIDADHKMLGLVKKISVGICGDAKAAAEALTQRLAGRTWPATPPRRSARADHRARRPPGKSRARRLDPRARPSLDMILRTEGEDLQRRPTCTRARCCANWKRPCRPTPWCPPTSATSTRWPTATCASRSRAASSPR
jgi:sulfoacetaldehyde acetyltransferase